MKIGYLTFGDADFTYGFELTLSSIESKYELFQITPKTVRLVDLLLVSVFWWEHLYSLAHWMRTAGVSKASQPRPRIIIGGMNTFNPVPLLPYGDAVFIGEGDHAGDEIWSDSCPHLWDGSATSMPWRSVDDVPTYILEKPPKRISRIEIARGCRRSCKFCLVSAIKPYREVSYERISESLRRARHTAVALFAPNPSAHSRYDDIHDLADRLGKRRCDTDVTFDKLGQRAGHYAQRFGLDGLSKRLRKSVRKKVSNEQLVEKARRMLRDYDGIVTIWFYVIVDLPGETEEDWLEFEDLFDQMSKLSGADRLWLNPMSNAFMPMPHTDMEAEGIHVDASVADRWNQCFAGRWRRVNIVSKNLMFRPSFRALSMIATRAGGEFQEIEECLYRNRAIRYTGSWRMKPIASVGRLDRLLQPWGGLDGYCQPIGDVSQAPWKMVSIDCRKGRRS
jgi:radical SAM superfamily enzyme YgiQ (UPF0313 family)